MLIDKALKKLSEVWGECYPLPLSKAEEKITRKELDTLTQYGCLSWKYEKGEWVLHKGRHYRRETERHG